MKLENETIEALLKIDFLSHARHLTVEAEVMTNLTLANKSINSLKWENLCLEKVGDVTVYLSKNYKELYNKNWNELAAEIRMNIEPTLNEKLDVLIKEGRLKENMKWQILFDMINIGLLKSYSSVCKSEFYECLYQIYASGYIPCGWKGKYPEGKIKVI